MSYYLFLDDIRSIFDVRKYCNLPNINDEEWTVVRSYKEFVDIITLRGVPQFVSLDHDLGISSYSECSNSVKNGYINYENICEMTGLDCAKCLINYCIEKDFQFPKYVVHSMNPIGKQNIISLIESFKKINISL
jgi:hypothetical protein